MASLLTEMPSVLDQREVWFTHLLLLGFDPTASEEKFKISFSRDMFFHINKKGMEVVMNFLFSKLNSHLAYEEFRDCWPVHDKKQEQQFRKTCANWLARIAKEEPKSRLPRLSASLLLSPGGDKFYQFLLRFSSYVLKVVLLRDAKSEERKVFIPSFVSSLESPAHREVCLSAIRAHVVRHCDRLVGRMDLTASLHDEWRTCAAKLTLEYRTSSKKGRELSERLNVLQEEQKQRAAKSTPKQSHHSEQALALSAEVMAMKRKSRMQKVRELWKAFDAYDGRSAQQREVVDTIVQGKANRHNINAREIVFQIPDMILQEYEALMREGKVGNTYEAGKLNLISLIQVWNCALEVLKNHIQAGGVPSFDGEAQYVSRELQAHRAHVAAAQKLRASLVELNESLEGNIQELESRLQGMRRAPGGQQGEGVSQHTGEDGTAPLLQIPQISVPSLGLDLLPPSPEKTVLASPDGQWREHITHLGLPAENFSTPEAMQNISRSVHLVSRHTKRSKPSKHLTQIPSHVSALPSLSAKERQDLSTFDDSPGSLTKASFLGRDPSSKSSKIPQSSKTTVTQGQGPRSEARVSRETEEKASRSKGRPVKATPTTTKHPSRESHRTITTSQATPKGIIQNPQSSARQKPRTKAFKPRQGKQDAPATAALMQTPTFRPQDPARTRLLEGMPRAHELLAEQIASAVASQTEGDHGVGFGNQSPSTPDMEMHSLVDPVSAMGTEAFASRDRIPRTPISKPMYRRPALQSQLSPVPQSPVVQRSFDGGPHPRGLESPITEPTHAVEGIHLSSHSVTQIHGEAAVQLESAKPLSPFTKVDTPVSAYLASAPIMSTTPSEPLASDTTSHLTHSHTEVAAPTSLGMPTLTTHTASPRPAQVQPESPASSHHSSDSQSDHSPSTDGMSSPAADEADELPPSSPVLEEQDGRTPTTVTLASTPHFSSSQVPPQSSITTPLTLAVSHMSSTTTTTTTVQTTVSVPAAQIAVTSLPEAVSSPLQPYETPLAPTTLESARKVAFESTPEVVTHIYTTPTQSPSLFATAQPPTPFQHANFDLESSDEELSGLSSGTAEGLPEDYADEEDSYLASETGQDKADHAESERHQLSGVQTEEGGIEDTGGTLSHEEPLPSLKTDDQTPHSLSHSGIDISSPAVFEKRNGQPCSTIPVGDLLYLTPLSHQPQPFIKQHITGAATEGQLIDLGTPARPPTTTEHHRPVEVALHAPSSQDKLPGYLPSHSQARAENGGVPGGSGRSAYHSTPSDLNLWLGGSTEGGIFDDDSPFLVPPSPQYSLSLNSDESLEQTSIQS